MSAYVGLNHLGRGAIPATRAEVMRKSSYRPSQPPRERCYPRDASFVTLPVANSNMSQPPRERCYPRDNSFLPRRLHGMRASQPPRERCYPRDEGIIHSHRVFGQVSTTSGEVLSPRHRDVQRCRVHGVVSTTSGEVLSPRRILGMLPCCRSCFRLNHLGRGAIPATERDYS